MLTLLFDSDIFAFKAAAINEVNTPFGKYSWEESALQDIDIRIDELMVELNADEAVMCLTHKDNFRYKVLDTYKGNRNRDEKARPELLPRVKNYLATEYRSYIRPHLEADDIMGILATHPKLIAGEKIIVSEDKDMRTVTASVYNPRHPELAVQKITPLEAAQFHMWQVIVGDATDGYSGCPGVGPASVYAEEIVQLDAEDLWDCVIEAYASKGFTEDDALIQARLAKILSSNFYNFKNKVVELWTPLSLQLLDQGY